MSSITYKKLTEYSTTILVFFLLIFSLFSDLTVFIYHVPLLFFIVLTTVKYTILSIVIFKIVQFNKKKQYITEINKYKNEIYIDDLTRCYNRKYMVLILKENLNLIRHRRNNLGLIMLDIDDFKYINDTYGHLCGDYVLKEVCDKIKSMLRKTDVLCRYGGDEFLIILNCIEDHVLQEIAKRIDNVFHNFKFSFENSILKINISLGFKIITSFSVVENVIKEVDNELYKAKRTKLKITNTYEQ